MTIEQVKFWVDVIFADYNDELNKNEIEEAKRIVNKSLDAMAIKALEQQPCDDCISREQAKDAMYALCDETGTLKDNPWRDNPHIDAITDVLDNLPPVTSKERTDWIPVSERLPEDCQRVLVTVVRYNGNSIVRVAEYYSRNNGKGIFQIQENSERWEVGEKGLLAWMPLPEPYKAESEDKND